MGDTLVRVADVADELVQSYLHRLTALIPGDQIKEAWFRVVAANPVLPLKTEAVVIEPVFEILITVTGWMPNLNQALSEAEARIAGGVRVLADAALDGEVTPDAMEHEGWLPTAVPRMTQLALT